MTLLLLLGTFSVTACSTDSIAQQSSIASLDEYLVTLKNDSPNGGELYCETSSGGERHPYDSCESFSELRDKGCFGYSMYDISMESRFAAVCAKVEALSGAEHSSEHYFSLESADWWQTLPAEVIPMSGGIHSGESWAIAKQRRDEFVEGKILNEISMSEVSSEPGHFSATLELRKDDCGETRNRLEMNAAMLADLDGDGVAELLIEGYRVDRSDTCSLGSGNSLGAAFSVVLKKGSSESPISVSSFPTIN